MKVVPSPGNRNQPESIHRRTSFSVEAGTDGNGHDRIGFPWQGRVLEKADLSNSGSSGGPHIAVSYEARSEKYWTVCEVIRTVRTRFAEVLCEKD